MQFNFLCVYVCSMLNVWREFVIYRCFTQSANVKVLFLLFFVPFFHNFHLIIFDTTNMRRKIYIWLWKKLMEWKQKIYAAMLFGCHNKCKKNSVKQCMRFKLNYIFSFFFAIKDDFMFHLYRIKCTCVYLCTNNIPN